MFSGCTSLPDVHFCDFSTVSSVEANAFNGMFSGCTGLKNNPDEDEEIVLGYDGAGASSVYMQMFKGCTGLEGGVVVQTTQVPNLMLREMFSGCSSLRDVTMHYRGALGGKSKSGRAYNWMLGVQDEGTYYCYRGTDLSIRGTNGIPVNWKVRYLDSMPLKFTAEEANSSVSMQIVKLRQDGNAPTASFECSLDGETWNAWDGSAITLSSVGDSVQIRSSELLQSISNQYGYRNFIMTGKLALDGSVMSLFANSDVDHSEYRVPEVSSYGLYGLFYGCTSLSSITNSVLEEVYFGGSAQYPMTLMFSNCTGLTDLSGITLPSSRSPYCFQQMFNGCIGLTAIPSWNYSRTSAYVGRYQGMFYNCSSLTSASVPDSGMDGQNAFGQMFYLCSSLSEMDVNFTGAYNTMNFMFWMMGVSSSGTFKCPEGADVSVRGTSGIPSGWTIEYKT